MYKKPMSLLLCLALLFALLPAGHAADLELAEPEEELIPIVDEGEVLCVNPLYRDTVSEEELAAELAGIEPAAAATDCATPEEAAAALRAGMRARESAVTIRYTGGGSYDNDKVMALALSHTGDPVEGDYLAFQYGGWSLHYVGGECRYTISYYSSAAQEAELDRAVDELFSRLRLDGKSDYEKIRAIYDFVCENTSYDYEHLDDDSYKLKFTAYGAMIRKSAVCQGYANLIYRLMLSAGIDCRIITGINHAWNIVKLGGVYYNLDATWDAGNAGFYAWFLKCMAHFPDHERKELYTTADFLAAYPMSASDYEAGGNPITLERNELTLWVGGPSETVRFSVESGFSYSSVNFSFPASGFVDISGAWSSVTIAPLAAGAGVVSVKLRDGDGTLVARANIHVTVLAQKPSPETTVVDSGVCGLDLSWTLNAAGTLTISGTGEMNDYGPASAPWAERAYEIKKLVVGEGATSIGACAFYDCAGLKSASLPDSLTAVGACAFFGCASLEELRIPSGVTAIGGYAFFGCASLREIAVPAGVTAVEGFCFCQCRALKRVTLPEGLTGIGPWAFNECAALAELAIPSGVTAIGDHAFCDCFALTGLTLPEGLTAIENNAFTHSGLRELKIPRGVTSIGYGAFEGCASLREIAVPAGVTAIGGRAFAESGLARILFEGKAPGIGDACFFSAEAEAFYAADDESWTSDVMQDYGGTIRWLPYEALVSLADRTEDFTGGRAAPGVGIRLASGETLFTVASEADRAVLVAVREGDGLCVLSCTTVGTMHSFLAELGEEARIVLAIKGDANLDGKLESRDGNMVSRASVNKYTISNSFARLLADIDGNGKLESRDGNMISRASVNKYAIPW